jgi:hypothetical protein
LRRLLSRVVQWCRFVCVLKRRKRGQAPPHLSSHPALDEFYNDPLSFRKFYKDFARIEQAPGALKRFKRIAPREDSAEFRRLRRACTRIHLDPSTGLVSPHAFGSKSSRFLLRMKF